MKLKEVTQWSLATNSRKVSLKFWTHSNLSRIRDSQIKSWIMLRILQTLRSKELSMIRHGKKKSSLTWKNNLLRNRLVFTGLIIRAVTLPACRVWITQDLLSTLTVNSKYMDLIDQSIICVPRLEEDLQSLKLVPDSSRWRIRQNYNNQVFNISTTIPILITISIPTTTVILDQGHFLNNLWAIFNSPTYWCRKVIK